MSLIGLYIGSATSSDPAPFFQRRFDTGGVIIALLFMGIFYVLGFGYFLLRDWKKIGSVGKRLMGLTVIDVRTSQPCSLGASLLRNFILIILQAIDLLVPFFTKNGQRIGDMAAHTLVVRKPAS